MRRCAFCVRAILVMILALSLAACGGHPPVRVAERLVWTRGSEVGVVDAGEGDVDLPVRPGDVVRFTSREPVRIAHVIRSSEGEAAAWQTYAPTHDVVLVRADLATVALRGARDTMKRAHVGLAEEPAYDWFALEDQALAWAAGPLGAPFPDVAPASRLDVENLTAIDDVLRATPDLAPPVVLALRSLVALRALRDLQGFRNFPYVRSSVSPFADGGASKTIEDAEFATLADGQPVTLRVDGPSDVFLFSRAERGAEEKTVAITVEEAGKRRGGTLSNLPKAAAARADVDAATANIAVMPRVHVHVPPGHHDYRVVARGSLVYSFAIESKAALHIGDAFGTRKDEGVLVARARLSCASEQTMSACAVALALAGDDASPAYGHAFGAATEKAQALAARVASGESLDRAASLESAAATSPSSALDALGRSAEATFDPAVRDAWWRATARETSWQTAPGDADRSWFAFLPPSEVPARCTGVKAEPAGRELGAAPVVVPSYAWRRVRAVRLLVLAPCTTSEPIQIELDGEVLTAQPSSGRVVWTVVVRGETSTLRRIDGGPGRITVLSSDPCLTRGTFVRAATVVQGRVALDYPAKARSPGVEIWVREGSGSHTVDVRSTKGDQAVQIVAKAEAAGALVATDAQGDHWLRAARVPLPSWAPAGVTVTSTEARSVAVRAIVRALRIPAEPEKVHAKPADPAAVMAISTKLLAASDDERRGALLVERALLLASMGAATAAEEDATAARGLGARAPRGEDPVSAANAALLPPEPTPLPLDVNAYGLEPDFDAGASRCRTSTSSPRSKIAALDAEARLRSPAGSLDRAFAARVIDAVLDAPPADPRAESLLVIGMPSSKWQLLRAVAGGAGRVPRPHESDRDLLVDEGAHLRPRIVAGDPFGERFVSVTHDRPARAFVADHGSARGRIDYVCVPRKLVEARGARCPLRIALGQGEPIDVAVTPTGRGSVAIPATRGRGYGAEIAMDVGAAPGEWVALLRIVFDAQVPGSSDVPGVGWVLDTPHIQYRFIVTPALPVRLHPSSAAIFRVDALPDGGGEPSVVCAVGGREVSIPANGKPIVVDAAAGEDVTIRTRGGRATLAIAERVDAPRALGGAVVRPRDVELGDVTASHVTLDGGAWQDQVASLPSPAGSVAEALGTLGVTSGLVAQTLREGVKIDSAADTFLFENVSYRRTIESLGLSGMLGASLHLRRDKNSYGGHASLYENMKEIRLRFAAFGDVFTQDVEGRAETAFRPRGFAEYSARIAPTVFILPRLGYDGYYSTFQRAPRSSLNVDDAVYNAFRLQRNTFFYLQSLFWWAPHFNDVFYVRARGTFDAENLGFSHAGLRPGGAAVFGATEIDVSVDAEYFVKTPGARATSSIDTTANAALTQHFPLVHRSVDLGASTAGGYRASDGSWQVLFALAMTLSPGRGPRDFSTFDLTFPEQIPGGTPWSSGAEGLSP